MDKPKVLEALITSLLCLNLQHETLLRNASFGGEPTSDVLSVAVTKTAGLVNEVLELDGVPPISREQVLLSLEPAWAKACQIDRLARHPADQWQRGNSSVL